MAPYVVMFLVTLAQGCALTWCALHAGRWFRILDFPDKQRKLHAHATPRTGGVAVCAALVLGVSCTRDALTTPSPVGPAGECGSSRPAWIWCDDFEQNRLDKYFEVDTSGGDFVRVAGSGVNGSTGMRAHFAAGQVSAGSRRCTLGTHGRDRRDRLRDRAEQ